MSAQDDVQLSADQISEKYPKGSPDYPSHHKGCGCSGCYASWLEWRAGHAAFELGVKHGAEKAVREEREAIVRYMLGPKRRQAYVILGARAIHVIAGDIEHGEHVK